MSKSMDLGFRILEVDATKPEMVFAARQLQKEMEMFEHNLPFPVIGNPPLIEMREGPWEIARNKLPGLVRGYFRAMHVPPSTENWVLRNWDQEAVWMSIAPMELESQSHHVHAASGRVLVGGLGLGVILWALLEKRDVSFITVVEKDRRVIELMREVWRRSPGWHRHLYRPGTTFGHRFEVIEGDMLNPGSAAWPYSVLGRGYDFGLVDIWPGAGDKDLRPDMQRIAREFKLVQEWAAWGMELDYVTWLIERGISMKNVHPLHWRDYSNDIGVPLIGQHWRWMAGLAIQAALVQTLDAVWYDAGYCIKQLDPNDLASEAARADEAEKGKRS